MTIEALPPDGGVARASVNGIEHIRLRDVASAVPGLQPDPRWPSISFADTAARMFIDEIGIEGVKIHCLEKRGRYVPRDQFQPAVDFLTSSATIAEAKNRTWAGINANRSRRTKAVQPIEIQDIITSGAGQVRNINASDLMQPIQFIVVERGLFFREKDIASSVSGAKSTGYYRQFAATMEEHTLYVGTPGRGHSHRFLHDDKINALLERLQQRNDYDRAQAVRLTRRLEELRTKIAGEIVAAALPAAQPDPVAIVAQTMEAGASQLPAILDDLPEIQQIRQEHGEAWAEMRRSRTDRLNGVSPEPSQRRSTAEEIVRRMGLVEASQEAMIERLDRVLAVKDEQIAGRDRQIGELQELVIGLGQFCTNLLGSISELKAIATR